MTEKHLDGEALYELVGADILGQRFIAGLHCVESMAKFVEEHREGKELLNDLSNEEIASRIVGYAKMVDDLRQEAEARALDKSFRKLKKRLKKAGVKADILVRAIEPDGYATGCQIELGKDIFMVRWLGEKDW